MKDMKCSGNSNVGMECRWWVITRGQWGMKEQVALERELLKPWLLTCSNVTVSIHCNLNSSFTWRLFEESRYGLGYWQWFCRAGSATVTGVSGSQCAGKDCVGSNTASARRDHIQWHGISQLLHSHHFIRGLDKVHAHWTAFSVLDLRPV